MALRVVGFTDEGGRGAVIQHLRGGESLGQGEKSGEGQWAGTPGGLRVGVYQKRGQLRRVAVLGKVLVAVGSHCRKLRAGEGGVSQKSCGGGAGNPGPWELQSREGRTLLSGLRCAL